MIRLIAGILLLLAVPAHATPGWVERSNENAQLLLQDLARYSPESAAQLGVEGFDGQVKDLKPRVSERSKADARKTIKELQARLKSEKDAAVRQDLQILVKAAEDHLRGQELTERLMLPYYPVARLVFDGFRGLLDPRIPRERQVLAVGRLRRYAGLGPGLEPITKLARERITEKLGNKKLVGPYKAQVEQDLADNPRLVAGIRDLFEKSGLPGYEEAMAALEKQLADYDAWVRKTILPRTRDSHRLPPEVYANQLRQFGVDVPPEELLADALVAFAEIRNEMQALAPLVAAQHKLDVADYREVLRELKKKQVYGKDILPLFEKRLAELEKIVKREKVATLPERDAVIRLASEAESAMSPAPHMRPPRLIGNTGEYGEFVLPLNVPGGKDGKDLRMDDFTSDAASWSLTVHEARPGHEMQFAAMLEKGVSIARAVFAFNSVNVEGWALYAEAEMRPYLPLDGQLFTLQFRLARAARAFLDPMLNLGQMEPDAARAFLMEEVVLSEAMAKQEVDRYTFRAPGQATSYFYGYQQLMKIRQAAEVTLRDKFDRQGFHDFVLGQGLVPPELLMKAVMDEYVPSRR